MDDHPREYEADAAEGPSKDAAAAGSAAESSAIAPTVSRWATPNLAATRATWAPGALNPDLLPVLGDGPDAHTTGGTPKRRKTKALIASGAAIVVAAAVVGGVMASGGSGAPGSGMAPADFVVSSTQTLAQRTADITYSGSVSVDGHDAPLNGTGQVDFDTNSFSASLTETVASTSIAVRELITSDQFFMGMSINGQDMSALTGGAHWVGISLPDQSSSSSLGAANVDPIGQLKTLEQKGATVTSLGTKTIDGDTVSGYSETPSQQEIENEIQQEIQQNQISSALGQQMLQAPNLLGTFTTDVWIDGSGLIRQENVNIAGGSAGIVAKATVDFENYGTPVSITAPAPTDVIPFTQFLNDLKSAETSSQG